MLKKLIISDMEHETRVALIENGTIAELFIERRDLSDIAGNIYKGRVQTRSSRDAGRFCGYRPQSGSVHLCG